MGYFIRQKTERWGWNLGSFVIRQQRSSKTVFCKASLYRYIYNSIQYFVLCPSRDERLDTLRLLTQNKPSHAWVILRASPPVIKGFLPVSSRGPAALRLPQHRHGPAAEGGGENQNRHHAVRRQRDPRSRDLLVQGLPPRGAGAQPRANQAAAIRYSRRSESFIRMNLCFLWALWTVTSSILSIDLNLTCFWKQTYTLREKVHLSST